MAARQRCRNESRVRRQPTTATTAVVTAMNALSRVDQWRTPGPPNTRRVRCRDEAESEEPDCQYYIRHIRPKPGPADLDSSTVDDPVEQHECRRHGDGVLFAE